MAIDSTLGLGTITAGTYLAPVTVLADVKGLVEGIINLDTTNWLALRRVGSTAPYQWALPGQVATISGGASPPLSAGAIEGFACTPNNAGTATLTAALVLYKNA